MKLISLEPFIPSGNDLEGSRALFQDLGFHINWDAGDYIGFQRDNCKFILQKFDNKEFAENLMINVRIESADEFWKELNEKKLAEKFGVKLRPPVDQPYGREVNMIDKAGVCWHFVE
jgi:hypothetical protein